MPDWSALLEFKIQIGLKELVIVEWIDSDRTTTAAAVLIAKARIAIKLDFGDRRRKFPFIATVHRRRHGRRVAFGKILSNRFRFFLGNDLFLQSYEEAEDAPRFFFTRRKIGKEMSCNATENMTTAAIDLP